MIGHAISQKLAALGIESEEVEAYEDAALLAYEGGSELVDMEKANAALDSLAERLMILEYARDAALERAESAEGRLAFALDCVRCPRRNKCLYRWPHEDAMAKCPKFREWAERTLGR
jgi:hypothetical protein